MDTYLIDMMEIQLGVVNELVSLADKYRISRDEVTKHFSAVMAVVAEEATLEGYELNKEEADENRG